MTQNYKTNMYITFLSILAPKLKGRPRKRKNNIRTTGVGSPAESEASSESSTSTSVSISAPKVELAIFTNGSILVNPLMSFVLF